MSARFLVAGDAAALASPAALKLMVALEVAGLPYTVASGADALRELCPPAAGCLPRPSLPARPAWLLSLAEQLLGRLLISTLVFHAVRCVAPVRPSWLTLCPAGAPNLPLPCPNHPAAIQPQPKPRLSSRASALSLLLVSFSLTPTRRLGTSS
ncbi:hypothetical protein BC831DRAFT_300718 [Entophlyctis helioformis]|nr:hypothetical protein BC831DRAFT_300718 [Entophlyctis helioformis]